MEFGKKLGKPWESVVSDIFSANVEHKAWKKLAWKKVYFATYWNFHQRLDNCSS